VDRSFVRVVIIFGNFIVAQSTVFNLHTRGGTETYVTISPAHLCTQYRVLSGSRKNLNSRKKGYPATSPIFAHGRLCSAESHCCCCAAIWCWMKLIACWTWALSHRSVVLWRKIRCRRPARGRPSCSVLHSPRKFRCANPHSCSYFAVYCVFNDIVQLRLFHTCSLCGLWGLMHPSCIC